MSDKENYLVLEHHPFGSLNNMNSTPTKPTGTTRVIDQLHSEIDELKRSLETSQSKVKEYKQKYDVVTKRSTQIIENLTNTKHENDMMNSMLLRKERRIKDLEEQLTETMSKVDTMEFDQKSKEARLQKFQDNENKLVGEHEILKMSYDALVRSQKEYKLYYEKEISYLKSNLAKHLKEREIKLNENIDKFNSNDIELVETFKKMTNKSNKLEELYKQKNNAIVEALKTLALAARDHGSKTIKVLNECEEILKAANRKLPTFTDNASDVQEGTTDLDSSVYVGDEGTELQQSKASSTSELLPVVARQRDSNDQPSTPRPPASLTLPTNFPQSKESRIDIVKRGHSRLSSVNSPSPPTEERIVERRSVSDSSGGVETPIPSPNQHLQRRVSNRRSSYHRKTSSNIDNQGKKISKGSNVPDEQEEKITTTDDPSMINNENDALELEKSVDISSDAINSGPEAKSNHNNNNNNGRRRGGKRKKGTGARNRNNGV